MGPITKCNNVEMTLLLGFFSFAEHVYKSFTMEGLVSNVIAFLFYCCDLLLYPYQIQIALWLWRIL